MYHDFNFGDVLASPVKRPGKSRTSYLPAPSSTWAAASDFDEAGAVFERRLKAPTGPATGTSKRAADAALGAWRTGYIQFPATPAAPSIAARGLGKPTVAALH